MTPVLQAPGFWSSLLGVASANAGGLSGFLGIFQQVMSRLESNPLLGLIISDLSGMVFPRTAIEWRKRGIIPAQETFLRESSGLVTNTFLAGWLGALMVRAFRAKIANPLAMDFSAWIDMPALNAFSKITEEIIRQNPGGITPEQLRQGFLKTVFGRLQSTDNAFQIKQYQPYLPPDGKLRNAHVEGLVKRYLGNHPYYQHHALNIEQAVASRIKQAEYREGVESAVEALRKKFLDTRGLAYPDALSPDQTQLLKKLEISERQKVELNQKNLIRQMETANCRRLEKPFLDRVCHYAIHKGQLTDEVYLLGKDGKPLAAMGARNLHDTLKKIKYFMEEYINRALAHPETGMIAKDVPFNIKSFNQRLYHNGGQSWLQKNLLPNLQDGLITYARKSKYFTALLPAAIALVAGCTMVFINNWLTRRKFGGQSFFPGERAFIDKPPGQGGGK